MPLNGGECIFKFTENGALLTAHLILKAGEDNLLCSGIRRFIHGIDYPSVILQREISIQAHKFIYPPDPLSDVRFESVWIAVKPADFYGIGEKRDLEPQLELFFPIKVLQCD